MRFLVDQDVSDRDGTLDVAVMSMSSGGGGAAVVGTTITINSYDFGQPLVKPGQTIDVVNDDSVPHTVTADAGGGFNVWVGGSGKAHSPRLRRPAPTPSLLDATRTCMARCRRLVTR